MIGIHLCASLYSRYKGEGIWNSMVPIFKEKGKNNSELFAKLEGIEDKIYSFIEDKIIRK